MNDRKNRLQNVMRGAEKDIDEIKEKYDDIDNSQEEDNEEGIDIEIEEEGFKEDMDPEDDLKEESKEETKSSKKKGVSGKGKKGSKAVDEGEDA